MTNLQKFNASNSVAPTTSDSILSGAKYDKTYDESFHRAIGAYKQNAHTIPPARRIRCYLTLYLCVSAGPDAWRMLTTVHSNVERFRHGYAGNPTSSDRMLWFRHRVVVVQRGISNRVMVPRPSYKIALDTEVDVMNHVFRRRR